MGREEERGGGLFGEFLWSCSAGSDQPAGPNDGHMTDTGECEGQKGCLAPEVRNRKQPPPLSPLFLPECNTGSLCPLSGNGNSLRFLKFLTCNSMKSKPKLNHN